jgi:hypothetical protein
MIRLTAVQSQVLTSLGVLVTSVPTSKIRYSLVEIYEARLYIIDKKDPKGVLKRTTENTLRKLKDFVPRLVTGGPITWGLTPAGIALVETQLGVKDGRTTTAVEDRDHDMDSVGPTQGRGLRARPCGRER